LIDLEKDIRITPEDIKEQERIRRRRQRPMSLDEYLRFLQMASRMFPLAKPRKKGLWKISDRKFEL